MKQFYWKDISNKNVKIRDMLRFPYLPANIFHSRSVAKMSENEGGGLTTLYIHKTSF